MPDAADKLTALAQSSIDALPGAPGSRAWVDAFTSILTRAHQAAYMAGIAERTGVDPRGLSRAERADMRAALDAQLEYLKGFVDALSGLSEAQVSARANLYAGAVRATFWQARTDNALPFYPGGCPQCLSNCRCRVTEKDGEWYWQAVGDERTCAGCKERASAWAPYRK